MKHRKNRISLKAARAWALLLVFLVSLAGTACSSNPDATGNNNPNKEEITMPKDAPLLSSDELIGMFAADSMVLLKNENNCLPLAKGTKLNLFGYNATDKGYLLSGGGSGTGVWASDANIVGFAQAFREAGVDINEELLSQYAFYFEEVKKSISHKMGDEAEALFAQIEEDGQRVLKDLQKNPLQMD